MEVPYFRLTLLATLMRVVLATSEMSVRPSVRLSNAWIANKNERNICQNCYTL